jgi:hypothetical protein
MQKISFFAIELALCLSIMVILTAFHFSQVNSDKISFILQNDLNYTLNLQIENNIVSINGGSAYKFSKSQGDKIYIVEHKEKKKLLLIVQESIQNKTLKISELVKKELK